MNKKSFITTIVIFILVVIGLIVTNLVYLKLMDKLLFDWIWVFVVLLLGYTFFRYRLTGPMQMFSTKFNLLVDYDLDVEQAETLAFEASENAPTQSIKMLYLLYLGMAQYYNAKYEASIKTLQEIDLRKLNKAYYVLVYAFLAYAAYELDNSELFKANLEKLKEVVLKLNQRLKAFGNSYVELLSAMGNIDEDPEHYKEVIERHFARNDGYISTQLVYHYRISDYYKVIKDDLEMDKHLAYVIANGKNHHTAIQAKSRFKNLVNIEDYLIKEEVEEEVELLETEDVLEDPIEEPDIFDQLEQKDK